ncbi:MAG: triose-phosphate isomerase [Campylobacterales bacterium]
MFLAANFKMHKTRREVENYLAQLEQVELDGVEVRVFPPFTGLLPHRFIGAQNGFPAEQGAYTGEIGLEQLREFQIDKILLGHSERRQLGESPQFIREKVEFYRAHNFEIFLCIGEPWEVRERGEVEGYLKGQLEGIPLEYPKLRLAYEPIWAIGTGKTPTIEEIGEVGEFLKGLSSAPVVYGGSVKLQNIEAILKLGPIDGALVGSASLQLETFLGMVEVAKKVKRWKDGNRR